MLWEVYRLIGEAALDSAPFWAPILLFVLAFELWIKYKRREFIKNQGSVLLEIKIPREMVKSPQAMENFLMTLHNTTAGNLVKVYLEGALRPWWSLEIVSIDGTVHFFIWCFAKQKGHVETQLYAQFPGIEVHEVPDYSLGVHHNPDKLNFGWFGQLTLTKDQAFPIKTYVEYGLDKNDEEEYKIDPLVTLLEYMGSLKKGEQAWVQILIQAHTEEKLEFGRLFKKPDWRKAVDEQIKEFIKKNAPAKEDDTKKPTVRDLTKDQQDLVYSMERNQGKWAFDSLIRITYFAEKEVFNPVNIGGLIGSFKQFSSTGMNGFRPQWNAGFKYPQFQDWKNMRKFKNERKLLEAYKRRSFFNVPFKNFHGKPYVLTTEELATLFHFPSSIVAATPTLSRIPSKKAEAPANLPV